MRVYMRHIGVIAVLSIALSAVAQKGTNVPVLHEEPVQTIRVKPSEFHVHRVYLGNSHFQPAGEIPDPLCLSADDAGTLGRRWGWSP